MKMARQNGSPTRDSPDYERWEKLDEKSYETNAKFWVEFHFSWIRIILPIYDWAKKKLLFWGLNMKHFLTFHELNRKFMIKGVGKNTND